MKKLLTNNPGIKIVSLLLAVLVWILVLSIEDPMTTVTFSDIVVSEINEDQISEAGKSYTYVGGNTVSVRVRGNTSVVSRLTRDDLVAVADLANLSVTGAVAVDVSCPKYPNLEITAIGSSTMLQVELQDIIEKSLNVKVITDGEAAGSFYIGQGTATPNLVVVSGPESDVNRVSEAVVNVTVVNAMSDVTARANLELLDAEGNVLSLSTLDVSETDIDVTVAIYPTKTVPMNFGVTGEPGEGYKLSSVTYEPKEVTLAGPRMQLIQIGEVTMPDYDITGLTESVEDSLNIADYLSYLLPDGVVVVDKDEALAFQAEIEPLVTTGFSVPLSRISLTGSGESYSYERSSSDSGGEESSELILMIEGTQEELDELSLSDITAYADVSGCEPGEYDLPVTVIISSGLELAEEAFIHVTVMPVPAE